MSGKALMIGLLAVTAVFAAALIWFQVFAYYERVTGVAALTVAGVAAPVDGYDGIAATSSPLKLRGCFRADPAAFAAAEAVRDAEPLTAPFWFRCYDARALALDLAAGTATAYRLEADSPAGFDLIAAVYPDGRGFLWRQLNERYR